MGLSLFCSLGSVYAVLLPETITIPTTNVTRSNGERKCQASFIGISEWVMPYRGGLKTLDKWRLTEVAYASLLLSVGHRCESPRLSREVMVT